MFQIEEDNPIKKRFKHGDKVLCVRGCPGTLLVRGVYTIDFIMEHYGEDFIHLVEILGRWAANRFIIY